MDSSSKRIREGAPIGFDTSHFNTLVQVLKRRIELHTFDDIGTVGCDDVDMVRHDAWGESWNFDILEEDAPEQSHRLAEEGSNPK